MVLEQELLTLAASGGSAIVGAMAADAWKSAKAQILVLLNKGPHGSGDSAAVEDALEHSRTAILQSSEGDAVIEHEEETWTSALEDLLEADPDAEHELREFVESFAPSSRGGLAQNVTAQRDAYIAGRDQHITVNNRAD